MTSTQPSDTTTTDTTSGAPSSPDASASPAGSSVPAPPVVGPVVGVDMRRGSKWDTDSGVQPGTITSRLGGFLVEHDDGTTSSYTLYGNEEVPGSVDDILKGYRDDVDAMIEAAQQ